MCIRDRLCSLLHSYAQKNNISSGMIFVTKNGKPLDRSNIWREMKALGIEANVKAEKIFPHNLRHLFARTYYEIEKNLSKLSLIHIYSTPLAAPLMSFRYWQTQGPMWE